MRTIPAAFYLQQPLPATAAATADRLPRLSGSADAVQFSARVRREHEMPFGPRRLPDGSYRFGLWAPSAKRINLVLKSGSADHELPMRRQRNGWFTLTTPLARVGDRYGFRADGQALVVPDPASRYQPEDVHGLSQLVDPQAFGWRDGAWRGRPWREAVIYELHVGAFTPEGTFQAIQQKLDYLKDLGVTAIQLMPLADFPGGRNWGYDGVLPYAPDARYGTPEDLKNLVQAAHQKGLMVFVDVVYNHLGPEGNYLHTYAREFFTGKHQTPWGSALAFDEPGRKAVREFFIHNLLYWFKEFNVDGFRLDAVHMIHDASDRHFLKELSSRLKAAAPPGREVHLILENDDNNADLLSRYDNGRPRHHTAQWNDDFHHALHVLLTGETGGYYQDYARALNLLGRALTQGFAYQGEPSKNRDGERRGEPSAHLPPGAFVNFLQNHDQVGNRAFGERLSQLSDPKALRAALSLLLLSPATPMLFMGEEWASKNPFLFFCDFGPDLAPKVSEGRRREFSRFPQFADPAVRERIPDPGKPETFAQSKLDWAALQAPAHRAWLTQYRQLLKIRREKILPLASRMREIRGDYQLLGDKALRTWWTLPDGRRLNMAANLGTSPCPLFLPPARLARAELLFESEASAFETLRGQRRLPPQTALWWLDDGTEAQQKGR